MYGYQIIMTVKERTQGLYTLREGALYPALHKLESSGYIESHWQAQTSGRDRRYYAILPAGEAHLVAKKAEWARFAGMVEAFLKPARGAPSGGPRPGTTLEFPGIPE